MIVNNKFYLNIRDCENPIFVWNIEDISRTHKYILYNMLVLAILGVAKWNTPEILSQVCCIDEEEILLKLEELVNKGYLTISYHKFYLTNKTFDEMKKSI